MKKTTIKAFPVTGMSCASCARNVENMISSQPGVRSASVNYATASAQVELDMANVSIPGIKTAVQSIGYDLLIDEEDQTTQDEYRLEHFKKLKRNTAWSVLLALPVVIVGMFLMDMPYANLIMMALTTPVLAWFGRSFFINAFKQARHIRANMDTLVALSTGIAYLFSVFNTFFPDFWNRHGVHPHVYFEATVVIISFILLGKVLEDRAKAKTSAAIKKLMGLQPRYVVQVDDNGNEKEVPIAAIHSGDRIVVKPGNRIPVDGDVLSGISAVDESTITGESMPVDKQPGSKVFAGTINLNGSFVLLALQVGSETLLAHIIEMVRQAQGSKAPVQKMADKIAGIFVPVVIAVSLTSFIIWMIFGGENAITQALLAMVTVLVIACPCALGLATPTAIMVGMGKGAENGILIKDAESLEKFHRVNAIVVDKTGTITEGKPRVTDIIWFISKDEQQIALQILLSLESRSSHPLAKAVTEALKSTAGKKIIPDSFTNISGKGVLARFNDKLYLAGNMKLMDDYGITVTDPVRHQIRTLQHASKTVIGFACDNIMIAVIALADKLKDTSPEAVKSLKDKGIEVYMLTGDNLQTAQVVAAQAGIDKIEAGLMPADKADFVKQLQFGGKVVAMAGDGINDSQALAQADVSIAMGKGSDIAIDVAGITILSSDLRQIARAIKLSKMTVRTIHQNLFWAFIYNLIGIPVAAGVLYPLWGFMLNPMIAAAAMAMSSVSVVSNSLRLRARKL